MKIELEFDNKNELSEFISGLNNAIIAYDYIIQGMFFECEIPNRFRKLKETKTIKELDNRLHILKKQYKQLEEIEKSFN